jgi:hypothetical protein
VKSLAALVVVAAMGLFLSLSGLYLLLWLTWQQTNPSAAGFCIMLGWLACLCACFLFGEVTRLSRRSL